MIWFISYFNDFIAKQDEFFDNHIGKRHSKALGYSIILTILTGFSFATFLSSTIGILNGLNPFLYFVFCMFVLMFFMILQVIYVGMIGFFLNKNGSSPIHFTHRDIYMLLSNSYYPYLLLPALVLVFKALELGSFSHILAFIILQFLVIYYRITFFDKYQKYFKASSIILAMIPALTFVFSAILIALIWLLFVVAALGQLF